MSGYICKDNLSTGAQLPPSQPAPAVSPRRSTALRAFPQLSVKPSNLTHPTATPFDFQGCSHLPHLLSQPQPTSPSRDDALPAPCHAPCSFLCPCLTLPTQTPAPSRPQTPRSTDPAEARSLSARGCGENTTRTPQHPLPDPTVPLTSFSHRSNIFGNITLGAGMQALPAPGGWSVPEAARRGKAAGSPAAGSPQPGQAAAERPRPRGSRCYCTFLSLKRHQFGAGSKKGSHGQGRGEGSRVPTGQGRGQRGMYRARGWRTVQLA